LPFVVVTSISSPVYGIRITAFVASAVGKTIVKVLAVTVLSLPKSKIATAFFPASVLLYINAPRAVNVEAVQTAFEKEM
jgi:hypothetical protein